MNLEDYSKYYIQGSDHYLIPKDVFKELFNEMLNWKEESIELNKKYVNAVADYETTMAEKNKLKKQLEEYKEQVNKGLYNTCLPYTTGYNKAIKDKEIQQKEFIKYLEDEIYSIEPKGTGINYNCDYDSEEDYVMAMQEQSRLNTLKEILQKYKEIIGDINDKK